MRIKIPGYPSYTYDLKEERVYSNKQGKNNYPLKWRNVGGILSVKLYNDTCLGIAHEYTKFKIRMMIENVINEAKTQFKEGKSDIMSKGFIVGSIDKKTGNWSISASPRIHTTRPSADSEAERLARGATNKKFVVLDVKGVCAVAELSWE